MTAKARADLRSTDNIAPASHRLFVYFHKFMLYLGRVACYDVEVEDVINKLNLSSAIMLASVRY